MRVLDHSQWLLVGVMLLMFWQLLEKRLRWVVPMWGVSLLLVASTWGVQLPEVLMLLGLQMGLVKRQALKQSLVVLIGLAFLPAVVCWPLWSLVALMLITVVTLFHHIWQGLNQKSRFHAISEFVVLLSVGAVILLNWSAWWSLVLIWIWVILPKPKQTGKSPTKASISPADIDLIQHNERQRIYRNIHDEVGASVLQLIYQLDGHTAQPQAKQVMQKIRQSVAKTAQFSLTVEDLFNDLCFETAARLAEAGVVFEGDSDIHVRDRLAPSLPMNITRIVREAISNVLRHAQASVVKMSVVWRPNQKTWVITDDGVGLNHHSHQGKGLKSIEQRANKMGAQVSWEVSRQGGTSLVLRWHDES